MRNQQAKWFQLMMFWSQSFIAGSNCLLAAEK
jgi:hypothetical protein